MMLLKKMYIMLRWKIFATNTTLNAKINKVNPNLGGPFRNSFWRGVAG